MKQFSNRYVLMISDIQLSTLKKLKKYGINPSQFIRQAIKEKIEKEWASIQKKEVIKDWPRWLYE